MDVFDLQTVMSTPDLRKSVEDYVHTTRLRPGSPAPSGQKEGENLTSLRLLRVIASADYYTDKTELMRNPPPVLVDIILDPFLYNVLPRSLLPTGLYIVAIAIATGFVARWMVAYLKTITKLQEPEKKMQ